MEGIVSVAVQFEGEGNLYGREALVEYDSSMLEKPDLQQCLQNEVCMKLGCASHPVFVYKTYEEVSGYIQGRPGRLQAPSRLQPKLVICTALLLVCSMRWAWT